MRCLLLCDSGSTKVATRVRREVPGHPPPAGVSAMGDIHHPTKIGVRRNPSVLNGMQA